LPWAQFWELKNPGPRVFVTGIKNVIKECRNRRKIWCAHRGPKDIDKSRKDSEVPIQLEGIHAWS